MDIKQLVINDSDIVYQNMIKGVTLVPLSKTIIVSDSNVYSQKRNKYLQRLNTEKIEFNSAIKKINNARKKRLELEKQRGLERQQKREKAVAKSKITLYWIIVIFLIAINLAFEKKVLEVLLYNGLNGLNGEEMFSGVWSALWPAWIVIAVSLLATAILGRKLLKDKDASWFCFIEVGALLVFPLVLAFVFPPCDTIIENIKELPILCAILYVVPVGVSGFISLAICRS